MKKISLVVLALIGISIGYYFMSPRRISPTGVLSNIKSLVEDTKTNFSSKLPADHQNILKTKVDQNFIDSLEKKALSVFREKFSEAELSSLNKILDSKEKQDLVLKYAKAYSETANLVGAEIFTFSSSEFAKSLIPVIPTTPQAIFPSGAPTPHIPNNPPATLNGQLPAGSAQVFRRPEQKLPQGFEKFTPPANIK